MLISALVFPSWFVDLEDKDKDKEGMWLPGNVNDL
jgi:hypothetical protein